MQKPMRGGATLALVIGAGVLGCDGRERAETATEAGNVERPAELPAGEQAAPGAVRDFLAWEEDWLAAEETPQGPAREALAVGLRRLATALEGVGANGGRAHVAFRAPVEQVRQAARAVEEAGAGGLAPPLKSACTAAAGLVEDLAEIRGSDPGVAADFRATADALPAAGALAPDDARIAACLARAAEALEELTAPAAPAAETGERAAEA